MIVLRFASLVVLALWLGGLATLGALAAPAIFDDIQAQQGGEGQALAGRVFGAVLGRFQLVALVLGGLLMGLLGIRAALGPRPRRLAIRLWTIALMLALHLTSMLWVSPRIDEIREDVGGPIATLPDDDPRRADFGLLHGASTGLMLMTLAAGLGLLWAETRDVH
jgi:hypothetical protein